MDYCLIHTIEFDNKFSSATWTFKNSIDAYWQFMDLIRNKNTTFFHYNEIFVLFDKNGKILKKTVFTEN